MISDFKEVLSCLCGGLPIVCGFSAEQSTPSCLTLTERALEQAARDLGYEYLRYSYWVKSSAVDKSNINAFSVNFSNFPSSWESFYNERSLYLKDPIVRIIQESSFKKHMVQGVWADAYDKAVLSPLGETAGQQESYIEGVKQLMVSAREYGLRSGYYYSWGDSAHQIVLSLASTRDGMDGQIESQEAFPSVIHSMVILVNQSILMTQGCIQCNKSLRIDGSRPISLSKAELRILQLLYEHRHATQKEIARYCDRSVDTVNHHLRSIRQKLNAPGASGHSLATYAAELNLL